MPYPNPVIGPFRETHTFALEEELLDSVKESGWRNHGTVASLVRDELRQFLEKPDRYIDIQAPPSGERHLNLKLPAGVWDALKEVGAEIHIPVAQIMRIAMHRVASK